MKKITFSLFVLGLLSFSVQAQVCDPTVAPTGLTSTYTPGSGAVLEWNAIPGSVGVQLRVDLPSGSTINKRIVGSAVDQFAVPEASLIPGTYTWRVLGACSTVPPYNVTPISLSNSFSIGVGGSCPATITDIDGNMYNTVQIGSQCWMQENLKVERYRNGDTIPNCLDSSTFSTGALTVYADSVVNNALYGLLYNWLAVNDPRGLCPTGWHVPTDQEWTQLITLLDPLTCGSCLGIEHSPEAGGQMKTTGTLEEGSGLWRAPNAGATNSSGFFGLPGGRMNADFGFFRLGYHGFWWTSSEISATRAWFRRLSYSSGTVFLFDDNKLDAFSVRCVLN